MSNKIAFIGVGNMAGAIVGGILQGNTAFKKDDILLYDKIKEKCESYGLTVSQNVLDAIKLADYVLFAVKPQNFPELLDEIKNSGIDLSKKVFVTIAAGISCERICRDLGDVSVIRVMPNTPLLINHGTTLLCKNSRVKDEEFDIIFKLFSSLGMAEKIDEKDMNAIIALTSSSPAYVFLFIKSMVDASIEAGISLDRDTLTKLACSAVAGSAELLSQSELGAEQLIKNVTSPNGTTERAMNVFYEEKLSEMIKRAMDACTKRANELSQG